MTRTTKRFTRAVAFFVLPLGPFNPSGLNPTSPALLKAKFEDGSYLIPSGANGRNCTQRSRDFGEVCQVIAVAPATFEQDQFSLSVTDQPSVDPFASSRAVSRFERNELTKQRTLSLVDTHVFSPTVINELCLGFFRNTNSTVAAPHFTNESFGIITPLVGIRPDLAQIDLRGDRDIGDRFRFGTPDDDTLDVQNSFTYADTLSFTKGSHSLKIGGELRRHQLNGNLQEGKNGQLNARSWGDFLTVGYANPEDKGRARQLSPSLNYGETVRGFRNVGLELVRG